mmetsp:Transcript_3723/g.3123  ORF Transcript_3723/g.3123 Transcript_3723/m.3123 type:complete len:122 (+) Transcript_3723:1074-1439(+)
MAMPRHRLGVPGRPGVPERLGVVRRLGVPGRPGRPGRPVPARIGPDSAVRRPILKAGVKQTEFNFSQIQGGRNIPKNRRPNKGVGVVNHMRNVKRGKHQSEVSKTQIQSLIDEYKQIEGRF